MKFYTFAFVIITSFLQLTASDTLHESSISQNTGKAFINELDFSGKCLHQRDWEQALINKDILEKLVLREISFCYSFFVDGEERFYPSAKYFGEQFPEVLEINFPMLTEFYFDWPCYLGWAYDDSPLIFISHQTTLETLSLNGWIFGREENRFMHEYLIVRDFRLLSSLTNLKFLSLTDTLFLPDNIEQMQYTLLPNLEIINADGSTIKGAHWDVFVPNLKVLSLAKSSINGTDMLHIAKLSQLKKLNLSLSKISGGNIKLLAKLNHLFELNLKGTDMTKADFSGLQTLKTLDLSNCKFSIASFMSLFELHNLKKLKLKNHLSEYENPNISQEMIQDLIGHLPDCDIEF
ncbi:MAG: hypothetical protein H0T62_12235 [Parachlamydiaceae bacterium]|nr:hypothetical protein [Parachlamydiaceae bacterium]